MSKIPEYEFAGLATTSGTTAGQVIKNTKFKYSTTDYKKLLEDKDIDLIVVATPHNTHAKFTVEALDAGKHVYVEKPMAITMEQLDEVKAAYERNNQHVLVGFNRRHSPFAKFIKENMSTDKYLLHNSIHSKCGIYSQRTLDPRPEVGGGRIIGEAWSLHRSCGFPNGFITRISKHGFIIGNTDHYFSSDNVSINLTFKNGSIANIIYTAMGSKSFPKERVTVFCNGNVGEIDNFVSATVYGNKRRNLESWSRIRGLSRNITQWRKQCS